MYLRVSIPSSRIAFEILLYFSNRIARKAKNERSPSDAPGPDTHYSSIREMRLLVLSAGEGAYLGGLKMADRYDAADLIAAPPALATTLAHPPQPPPPLPQMNYYEILYVPMTTPYAKPQANPCSGVPQTSSSQEIRQAYRRIALTSHPDKVKAQDRDEATRKFQQIQLAYDVLQDPDRRTAYDYEAFGPAANVSTPPRQTTSPADGANGAFGGKRPGWSWTRDMPPSPESPGRRGWGAQAQNEWYAKFRSGREDGDFRDGEEEEDEEFSRREEERYRRERAEGQYAQDRTGGQYKSGRDNNWTFVTFLDATLLFRPEDRRQIWLCNDEDDPACYGAQHLTKVLYVSLQE
jgi:curved DNA-binding protein CbpA